MISKVKSSFPGFSYKFWYAVFQYMHKSFKLLINDFNVDSTTCDTDRTMINEALSPDGKYS